MKTPSDTEARQEETGVNASVSRPADAIKPRILIAVHQIPYPKTRDGLVGVVHPLLEQLSDTYAIDLVCPVFNGDDVDRKAIEALEPYCDRIVAFPFTRSRIWRLLVALFDPRSLVYFLYPAVLVRRRIFSRIKEHLSDYQAVLVADLHLALMAAQLDPNNTARRILISLDFLTLSYERLAASPGLSLRRIYWWLTARRVGKYEPRINRMYDDIIYVSSEDRRQLSRRDPDSAERVRVIPIALDISHWVRKPDSPAVERDVVLFTGNMNYGPNQHAVAWFHKNVWPRLRAARPTSRWFIIGYDADKHLGNLGPGVEVHSSVPDIAPYVHRATVMVSPLQNGTGMKYKVIENMAAGKAVVGTKLSFDGIAITNGVEAVISDDPSDMAQKIAFLFENDTRRAAIEAKAAKFAYEKFEMSSVIKLWRKVIDAPVDPAQR